MPKTFPPKDVTALVEVQSKQLGDLSERLGILHEVVAKRQEEADALKHDLLQTQAQIASAKRVWEQHQRQEQARISLWHQEQQDLIAQRRNEVEKAYRDARESLQRTQAFEEEIRLGVIELNTKQSEFNQLAQDRIDSGRLRQQAEEKLREAQTLQGQLLHVQNQANAKMEDARQMQAECEYRTLDMQAAWNKCRAWEEELRLKARDVEIRETAIVRREAELKAVQQESVLA